MEVVAWIAVTVVLVMKILRNTTVMEAWCPLNIAWDKLFHETITLAMTTSEATTKEGPLAIIPMMMGNRRHSITMTTRLNTVHGLEFLFTRV